MEPRAVPAVGGGKGKTVNKSKNWKLKAVERKSLGMNSVDNDFKAIGDELDL